MLCLYPIFDIFKQKLHILAITTLLFFSFISFGQTNVSDSLALVSLYNSTNGNNWIKNDGWLSGSVQNWYGITTINGRVTEIFLPSNNLSGDLPPEIGDLGELKNLLLIGNNVGGSLPPEIGNLNKLFFLYLLGNSFTGALPSTLGGLTAVVELHLAGNQFDGTIPDVFDNLPSLVNLNLKNNAFSGPIPLTIGDAPNLQFIELQNNELTGTIPSTITKPNLLRQIYLNGNNLNGPLPSDLGNAANLEGLYLNNNQITGILPTSLGQLTKLKVLDISDNQLQGSIPASLSGMTDIVNIYLQNNLLQGSIPQNLADAGNLSNLVELKLSNNQLEGTLPSNFSNFSSLKKLELNDNNFSGVVPTDWGLMTDLETLLLNDNDLEGAIPTQLTNLANLKYLDLSNNVIDDLPDLSPLTSLISLYVGNNKLTFEDLEPNVGVASSNFLYSPQANVNSSYTIDTYIGETESMVTLIGGNSNVYTWKRDGIIVLEEESESFLLIDPITSQSDGIYICEVTNKTVENLTIYRNPVEVNVLNPLPIELLSFKAKVIRMDVALSWITLAEKENAYFRLERSKDGQNFERVAIISGQGTSNEETYYSFVDEEPYFGISYYRLIQFDYDGTSTYSNVIAVEVEEMYIERLFPNPAQVGKELTLRSNISGNVQVKMLDVNGLEVFNANFPDQEAFQNIQITPENIVPGFYLIVLDNNWKRLVRKVMILQ